MNDEDKLNQLAKKLPLRKEQVKGYVKEHANRKKGQAKVASCTNALSCMCVALNAVCILRRLSCVSTVF